MNSIERSTVHASRITDAWTVVNGERMKVIGPRFQVKVPVPLGYEAAPKAQQRAFWAAVSQYVSEAKEAELRARLDRFGVPMAALAKSTVKNRHSDMGPADPHGPQLQPAHGLSRTRALFTAQPTARLDGVTCFWSYDEHTADSWGEILRYHKKGNRNLPVRDVIGLAPQSLATVRNRAMAWWAVFNDLTASAVRARPVEPDPTPKFMVRRIPANDTPKAAKRVSQLEVNGKSYTFQSGSAAKVRDAIGLGKFSGFHTYEQVQANLAKSGVERQAGGRYKFSFGPRPSPSPAKVGGPAPKPAPKPTTALKPKPAPAPPSWVPRADADSPDRIEHLRRVREAHANAIVRRAADFRLTPEQYSAKVAARAQAMVKSGDLYIRAEAGTLPRILESGRIKSQFETGTSQGAFDPAARTHVESRQFGLGEGTADADRPIYGYVARKDFTSYGGPSQTWVSCYGEVAIRLKDHMRGRTTVTFGDSLAKFDTVAAVKADRVAIDAIPVDRPDWMRLHREILDSPPEEALDRFAEGFGYVEAQYFGGVSLDDVRDIVFPIRPDPAVVELLKARGIPWQVKGQP